MNNTKCTQQVVFIYTHALTYAKIIKKVMTLRGSGADTRGIDRVECGGNVVNIVTMCEGL